MTYFKNKNIWFWGFMILLIINISVISSMAFVMHNIHKNADYKPFHHSVIKDKHPRHNKGTKSLIMKLNLNDEQRKTMGTIRRAHFQEMRKLRQALRYNQHELFAEVYSNEPDSVTIADYRQKNIEIQERIIDESLIFFEKIRKDLDDEQQELLRAHYKAKFDKNNHTQIKK